MLSYTDTLIILPTMSSKEVILDVHKELSSMGARIAIGDLYYLNDYQDREFEPEDIINPNEALQKVIDWPTSGWIKYNISGCNFLISYITGSEFKIQAISISEQVYDLEKYNDRMVNFIKNIHFKFNALRTIQGELIFDKIEIEEEIERVYLDVFEGKYAMDMRPEK